MVMWMLSRWIHIGGAGFVSLPCAKVSAASRKLKSSGTNGRGMGTPGSIASRRTKAERPTTATEMPRLFANRPKVASIREKNGDPNLGNTKAAATAIRVRPNSTARIEAGWPGSGGAIIRGTFALLAMGVTGCFEPLQGPLSVGVILLSHFSSGCTESRHLDHAQPMRHETRGSG